MRAGRTAPTSPAGPSSERVLQEGSGRRIVREVGGLTVRKTFSVGSLRERERTAADELSRLSRVSVALAAVPGATCPRPLGPVHDPDPGYRMSWVEGEDLADYLRRVVPEEELTRMGRTIAAALRAYVPSVGEPYYDLKLGNILVGPAGELVFCDVGLPDGDVLSAPEDTAYEVSVGNLLASLVFESARPRWCLHRRLHRQSAVVAAALVTGLRDGGQPLQGDVLRAAADFAYRRNTFGRGSLSRTVWYATLGWAVGLRVRTPAGAVGPAPFRRTRAALLG